MKRRRSQGKPVRGEHPFERQLRHRQEKTRVLIVCEGKETEPNYFRGLQDEEAVWQRFFIEIKKGRGGSGLAVVQQTVAAIAKAESRAQQYDEVWCVFDVERAGLREQVGQAVQLAQRHAIRLALSNPCFECFLLAHFVRTKGSFASCEQVIPALNKHWRREFERVYERNDEHLYARLGDRIRSAIDNARKVREKDWASSPDITDCNSATDVYLLVERLLGLSSPGS